MDALTTSRAARYGSRVERPALRVGVLHDFQRDDGGAAFEWAVRLGIEPVARQGRLPSPIEFVHEPAHGGEQPIARAFARLVEQGVLAILGPALTDGALAIRPLADAAGVPCINYAGNDQARGEYLFHFQIGSLEDEPPLLVGDLVGRGVARLVIQDASEVGRRLAAFFVAAAVAAGCKVVAHTVVEIDGSGAARAVADARAAGAEALVSLGFWRAAQAAARELRAQAWLVPALANSALMYGHADPAWALDWEGWTYADTYDEANPRFAALARRAAADGRACGQAKRAPMTWPSARRGDRPRAGAENRVGLRAGLERVKALPTATGRAATVMGFGTGTAAPSRARIWSCANGGRAVGHARGDVMSGEARGPDAVTGASRGTAGRSPSASRRAAPRSCARRGRRPRIRRSPRNDSRDRRRHRQAGDARSRCVATSAVPTVRPGRAHAEQFGRVDVLVNNAMAPTLPLDDLTLESWDESMTANVRPDRPGETGRAADAGAGRRQHHQHRPAVPTMRPPPRCRRDSSLLGRQSGDGTLHDRARAELVERGIA
jgi:ABC-type branched-subunit amino acid transport system substrate-binding protein